MVPAPKIIHKLHPVVLIIKCMGRAWSRGLHYPNLILKAERAWEFLTDFSRYFYCGTRYFTRINYPNSIYFIKPAHREVKVKTFHH